MENRVPGLRPVHGQGPAEDRLQSWKEIAAYLGRDIRSVARWEKTEQLPIHRLQHGTHGSVYASKSELDAWLAARTDGPRPKEPRGRWVVWATAAAGGVVLGLCAYLAVAWRMSSSEPLLALPFSSGPGVQVQPELSPDGRQVAYAWNGEDRQNFDIYVKLAAGGPALQLTHDPADDYSPAWSPDGAFIAFLRRKDAERVTVVVAPALGGTERALTELVSGVKLDWPSPGPFLTWSRDGKYLVMSGRPEAYGRDRLLRISVSTGETLPLTTPPPQVYGDYSPAVSPDGATLAFSRRISWGTSRLCLMPVGRDVAPAGDVRQLDTGSAWNASPTWLPDGESLILSTGSMDLPHLARIAASGRAKATRLAGFGDYGWQPSLSRTTEGTTRLVYVQHFETANLWRQPMDHPGPASQVVTSSHRSYEPDYSPDGSRIAFLSDRSGYVEVWVTASDGTNPQQWTNLKQASLGAPRWSPDGRRIAFTKPGAQGSSIYWIDAPGAGLREVPDSTPSGYLAWAPDGQSIYFSTNRGGATNVWRVPLAGGAAVQVTRQNSSRVPAVSIDKTSLFFMKMVSADGALDLFRVPLAGGEEKKVLAFVDAYSACRDGIAYKFYRPGPNPDGPHMQFYRFATGETEPLARSSKPLRYGVAVSPDCRYLLYSQVDYDVSDLMLVEGFR